MSFDPSGDGLDDVRCEEAERTLAGLNLVFAMLDMALRSPATPPKKGRLVVESMDKLSIARIDSSAIWGYTFTRFC
jgi:hypothetical protein